MGGYVYRGSQYPSLESLYFYADYVVGSFCAMTTCSWHVTPLGHLLDNASTFGQDAAGQLYVASLSDGHVYKLVGPAAQAALARPGEGDRLYLPVIMRQPACS